MKKVILFLLAIQAFSLFAQKGNEDVLKMSNIKATQTLGMIDYFYVDTTDLNRICERQCSKSLTLIVFLLTKMRWQR